MPNEDIDLSDEDKDLLRQRKRGALGAEEKEFIRKNIKIRTILEIANAINRTEDAVRNFVKADSLPEIVKEAPKIKKRDLGLIDENEWELLKKQFSTEELKFFKERYSKYMEQIGEDALPTEKTQIEMLIKYEILQARNLESTNKMQRDIERLEKEVETCYQKFSDKEDMTDADKSYVQNIEQQVLAYRAAITSKSSEIVKLTEKHSSIMKEMKATRDQRLSKIDNAAKDIMSLMKSMQLEDFKEREGYESALINEASKKENERLGQFHQYIDGTVDIPMLTPENVLRISEDE